MTKDFDIDLPDELLTHQDGPFGLHVTDEAKSRVAIFKSGKVFALEGGLRHPDVQTIICVLEDAGHKLMLAPADVTIVDNGTLRGIYEGKAASSTTSLAPVGPTENNDSEKREDAYRLFARAVRTAGVSDLIVKYETDFPSVHQIVDGDMEDLIDLNWSPQYALEFQKAVQAWAGDEGNGSSELGWRQNSHQMGSISRGLPPGLDTVRLEYLATGFGGKELIARLQHTPKGGRIDLNTLNFDPVDLKTINKIVQSSGGITIATGPTGHGKTRLLYGMQQRALDYFPADRWINIERPIEVRLRNKRITQIDVIQVGGFSAAADAWQESLSASMRGVPRKLLIGEVVRPEEADVAIRTALTGHGVLTTTHTPDTAGAIIRLLDLGVSASTLCNQRRIRAILGIRLIKRTCPHCSRKVDLADWEDDCPEWIEEVIKDCGHLKAANPEGCSQCRRGYIPGRIPLLEILRPDRQYLELATAGREDDAHAHWVKNLGGQTLVSKIIAGMKEGRFDPKEAIRCTDF